MTTQRKIIDSYTLGKEIGVGTFSKVVLGVAIDTNEQVAIKVIDKTVLSAKQKDRLQTEIDILSQCKHPNIIRLKDHLESENEVYLVMD